MIRSVGFIGVGRMGSALAGCVVEAGFPVMAYDVNPEAIAAVPGLTAVGSPREAAGADVVAVAVMDEDQVLAVATGPDGLLAGARRGTPILIHSTIGHGALRRLAELAAPLGIPVLDAPVSGPFGHRSVPDLCVMVGGDDAAYTRAEPVLRSFASLTVHLGPSGAGMDAKLSLNLLRYEGYLAAREAKRLACASGIDQGQFGDLVAHSGAFEFSPSYEPVFTEDLARRQLNAATARKDLRAATARAAELGLTLPSTEQTLRVIPTLWDLPAEPPA